jgi:hypothetical protein
MRLLCVDPGAALEAWKADIDLSGSVLDTSTFYATDAGYYGYIE